MIQIRTLDNEILLKQDFSGKYETSENIIKNTRSIQRSFFEFNDNYYNVKYIHELKIEILSIDENGFLVQACLENFLNVLLKIFKEPSIDIIKERLTDVLFILNTMFLDGKIIEVEPKKVIEEYKYFLQMKKIELD